MARTTLLFFVLPSFVTLAAVACSSSAADDPNSSSSSGGSSSSSSSSGNPPPISNKDGGSDPTTGDVRYFAMGDSLTEGVGAESAEKTWVAQLADKWRARGCKVELTNVGISGYTTEDIIRDQVPQIKDVKPTIITFQTGANDIANGHTIDKYRAGVKTILAAAKGGGARVLVMPQNEWYRSPQGKEYGPDLDKKRAQFDGVLIEEINAAGAEFIDLRAMFKKHADANMWVSDGIHPTPAAYTEWANEMARVIPSPCGK